MNEVQNAILTRRSVRAYKNDPIPKDVLEAILEAGTYAATGMNRQSPIIIAVTNKELRDRLSVGTQRQDHGTGGERSLLRCARGADRFG